MKTSQITASVFVVCLLSFSFFAPGAFKAHAYEPLTAEIPVYCLSVAGAETQFYQIRIQPEHDEMPVPAADTLTVAENGSDSFEIQITEPGIYRYQIFESAGSDHDIRYDDRIYEVSVFAENGEADTLVCAVIANLAGSAEKAEQIRFQNITDEPPVTEATTTASASQTTVTITGTSAPETTVTQQTSPFTGFVHSIWTGDRFPVRPLFVTVFAAMAAALSAFLFRRKSRGKEGEP